jgi:methionyl-tRNA formyltransferase
MTEATAATLGFFLMTAKGLAVLEAGIHAFGSTRIAYVVSARDQNLVDDCFDQIVERCNQNRIPFFEKKKPASLLSTYTFAISWRWLINDVENLIVLHDSLLPKYRGFAPLPTALIKGEDRIGVTALFADEEFDRGDILGQKQTSVSYPIKIKAAIELVSCLYSDLVVEIGGQVLRGERLVGSKQDEAQVTYSLWRDEEDYLIRWENDATSIKRFIDSLGDPYKGAASLMNGQQVRIYDAEVEPDVCVEDRQVGKVLFIRKGFPVIVCGSGLLKITVLCDSETQLSLLPLKRFRSRFV